MSSAPAKPWSYRASVAESDLPAGTKLVLLVLSLRVNDMGDPTWPSYNTIAKDASLSRNSAIKHVALAIERGWIARERRFNAQLRKNDSNSYRLQTPDRSFVSEAKPAEFEASEGGANSALPPSTSASNEAGGGANSALGWSNGCTRVVQNLDPNTSNEYVQGSKHPSSPAAPAKAEAGNGEEKAGQTYPEDFLLFWQAYPRKQGKLAALKNWQHALKVIGGKRADAVAKLLAGAIHYAKATAQLEATKVKMAEGWLTAGRWDDEEAPEASAVPLDWWLSAPGFDAKAKELGIPARGSSESPHAFRLRVLVASGPGKWQDAELTKAERDNASGYVSQLKKLFGHADIQSPMPAPAGVPRAEHPAKSAPPAAFKQALANLKIGKAG